MRNQLNKGHPSWSGRDGQELDPDTGRDLALSFPLDGSVDFEELNSNIERSRSSRNQVIPRIRFVLMGGWKKRKNYLGKIRENL